MLASVVLCVPGVVLSFVPSSLPARWQHERAVGGLTRGLESPIESCASRALARTCCVRATGPVDDHSIPQGHLTAEAPTSIAEDKGKTRSRWAKGQGTWAPRGKKGPAADKGNDPVGAGGGVEVDQLMGIKAPEVGGTFMSDDDAMRLEEAMDQGTQEEESSQPAVKVTKKRLKKYFVSDFEDSSWTVGIQWKSKPYEIYTTKVALKKDGSVVWLDKGQGSWSLRTRSRDLVFYRDFFWNWNGKRIYSAKLLNNTCDMYLEGVIKGWAPFLQLGIYGHFQAVRRGVTIDENTPRPPWEDRPVPELDIPKSMGRRTNRAVIKSVPLD